MDIAENNTNKLQMDTNSHKIEHKNAIRRTLLDKLFRTILAEFLVSAAKIK